MIPGALSQKTGGYLYDARMTERLRARGWSVTVHELEGAFPAGDAEARGAMERVLSALPDGSLVLLDGLAMGGLPESISAHAARLRLLSLVHHPLFLETGLTAEERRAFRAREAEALAHCRGVMVTSAVTGGQVEALGVPSSRVRIAPPGTDPVGSARGPEPGAPVEFLCVASVVPRKGHDVLVRALERLDARSPVPWVCRCVGSLKRAPAFADRVRELIRESGLTERVVLAGECTDADLDTWWDRASVFVLASHHEGYGMVLTEAVARGLPVVATTGGAVPDTLPDGVGLLVPPGDAAALAGALNSFLSPEARDRAGARARAAAASLPGWDEAAGVFERALRSLAPDS